MPSFTVAIFFMKAFCSSSSGMFSASALKNSSMLADSPCVRFTSTRASGPTCRDRERSTSASASADSATAGALRTEVAAGRVRCGSAVLVAPPGLNRSTWRIAACISAAVWKRSSAFFASAREITASKPGGMPGFTAEGGSGSSCSTRCMTVAGVSARNGLTPVSIS